METNYEDDIKKRLWKKEQNWKSYAIKNVD